MVFSCAIKRLLFAALGMLFGCLAWGQSIAAWHPINQWSGSSINCPDEKERGELLKKASKGDTEAEDLLGAVNLSTCAGKNDPAKGIELLERSAAKGNAHAQVTLADAYRRGKPGHPDINKALQWYEKAAQSGDARAQNDLGLIYDQGSQVTTDEARAAKLFLSAAERDLPEAQYNVATMFDRGRGVTQSYELARKWYTEAARHKNGEAEYRLAMLWEQGLGGRKDQEAATEWFKKAAKDGSEDAQLHLGEKQPSQAKTIDSGYFQYAIAMDMLTGKGVSQNEAQAVVFLQKSTEAGYPPAMVQLAQMYRSGQGVQKNEVRALQYLQQAIARDNKYDVAYNNLAWLYVTADDVKLRNPQKALEYASKAVELTGGHDANNLDTLARAHFQLGNLDKAIEVETQAATLAPSDESIQKTLQEYKDAKQHQPAK